MNFMSKQCNAIIKTIQNSPRRNISLRYWTRLAGRVNTLFAKKLYNFTKTRLNEFFFFFFFFLTCSKFIHRNDRGRSCKLIRNTDQSSNGNKNKINQPIQHHHLRLSLSHELAFFPGQQRVTPTQRLFVAFTVRAAKRCKTV